jgi:hypothetical protein
LAKHSIRQFFIADNSVNFILYHNKTLRTTFVCRKWGLCVKPKCSFSIKVRWWLDSSVLRLPHLTATENTLVAMLPIAHKRMWYV